MTTNEELFARAQRVIPGGVNSPVRAFRSVGGTPYFVARASGAQVWDAGVANPRTVMPPFGRHGILSEDEIDKVVEFLLTL